MDKRYFVSVDIESFGDGLDATIPALGFVVGDDQGNEVEYKLFKLPFDDTQIDPRCKAEFWDKQPGLLDSFRDTEFKTYEEGWRVIADYINGLEIKYPRLTFVSDNPAFDIGAIDHNLLKYANRRPMRYTSTGQYRSINDPSERLHMCPDWFRNTFVKKFSHIHSHNPCDDARYIYLQQIYTDRYRNGSLFSFFRWRLCGW